MFELSEDGTIPLKPGIVAVLLGELARRAGFTWRNRFVSDIIDENDKQNNKTWTDLLVWSTNKFDISEAFFNASNQRRALGIKFPVFWYDDSIILISLKKPKIVYMGFMRPYEISVWILIRVSILVTSLLYVYLEWLSFTSGDGNVDYRRPHAYDSAFLTCLTFTGHFRFMVSTRTLL